MSKTILYVFLRGDSKLSPGSVTVTGKGGSAPANLFREPQNATPEQGTAPSSAGSRAATVRSMKHDVTRPQSACGKNVQQSVSQLVS